MTQKPSRVAHHREPERWGSKIGIILAVAGSAIGLGNFLRFPVQAAQNGGGAFMIPYFVALLLLGIPLALVEWTIGRFGGAHGHNTAAGAFGSMWRWRGAKYLGLLGVFGPWVIFLYYIYVESWTLAYGYFSITGLLNDAHDQAGLVAFLRSFQGLLPSGVFRDIGAAYFFFLVTFGVNLLVLAGGIRRGIELVSKIFLPLLFLFAVILVIRVFWLGAPHEMHPEWNVIEGLGYLWNPNFSVLGNSRVWLAAAGQILFTLSVGIGAIVTYASYLKRDEDVTLSSLTAVGMNEFAEVILGGCLIIPAAFAFFGPHQMTEIAKGGAFNLGFVTMPLVFGSLPLGNLFGCLWFLLLFLAGITSSISLAQPVIAFFQNVFGFKRNKAVGIFGILSFLLAQPAIWWLGYGVVDEMDFWAGTVCLVIFALLEVILFGWVFGMEHGWRQIHHAAQIKLHSVFKTVIRYVTPAYLLFVLGFWLYDNAKTTILMAGLDPANRPYVMGTRWMLIGLFLILALSMRWALKHRKPHEA
ncbi:MAG: sodium-dependent transporter [Candidatus Omnitrophica bacterium]|nr:sodium-dependent transporter [Candidatus Omnitrophota bacterium]MBI2174460.1 sodium-dependent transporter [Candidatus Omnitrophota bacterium]MBI3009930.1 sodium-dependent transporter [Candidatus Omnitrophota bacterium]